MNKYLLTLFTVAVFLNFGERVNSTQFKGRINDGSNANDEHDFTVRIISAVSADSQLGYISSGVAVTQNHVVTVAQAIYGFKIWYIGHGSIHVENQKESISTNAKAHPNYFSTFLHYNIGVIRVSNLIATTIPIIQPSMPSAVLGYGVTNDENNLAGTLQFLSLITMHDNSLCLPIFNDVVVRSDNICSVATTGYLTNGDQGGPVTNSAFTGVFAIVSFWNSAGAIAVTVNLNEHIDFITSQLI